MTVRVSAGSGAAPPKAPPAPKYNLPKASTSSASNPRGLAVAPAPKPTINDKAIRTLASGANPRGTAVVHATPTVTRPKPAPKPKSSGTSWLSVITSPAAITHDIGHALSGVGKTALHITENVGKDLYQMPTNMLEGGEAVGKAAVTDFMNALKHGNTSVLPGGPTNSGGFFNDSNLGKIAHSAWQTSAIHDLAHGNVKGAVKKFTTHPVYTALDFAGGAGAIGRIAGIAARTGALGSKAAEVAALARDAHEIGPGLQRNIQHGSPNLLKRTGQRYLDTHPTVGRVVHAAEGKSDKRLLRRQADEIKAQTDYSRQKAQEQAATDLKTAMPSTRRGATPAAHVVPYAVQGIARLGDQTQFLADLQHMVDRLDHEHDHGDLTPRMKTANREHAQHIRDFLKHPDIQAVKQAASDYSARQAALDNESARLGLIDSEQARQRALMPYIAAGHMPGVRIATEPEVSIRQASWREADKAVGQLNKTLQATNLDNVKLLGSSPMDSAIRDAKTKLANARVQEQRTYGILLGRHGRDAALPPEVSARMNRYLDRTSDAQHELDQARVALRSDRADRKAYAASRLAAAQDALKDAKLHRDALSQYENEKIKGVVTNTDMPLGKGKYAVRRVTAPEIEAHMRANGLDPEQISYVNMSAPPARTLASYMRKDGLSRGDTKPRAFTGQGLLSGSWEPGYGALSKSQLGTTNKLATAKGYDEFIKQGAVHDSTGAVQTFTADKAERAAADYTDQHGVEVTPVAIHSATVAKGASSKIRSLQRNYGMVNSDEFVKPEDAPKDQRFALMPTEMADRYLKHLAADKVGHGMVGALNRQFRNTVLPFSAKWLMGNDVEGGLRLGLKGAGPRDHALVDKVLSRMDPADAERLESTMSGLHYGMAHRQNLDAIGAGAPLSNSPEVLRVIRHSPVVKQLADAYTGLVQRIYSVNRNMERHMEQAALGAHMHRQMREFGASWLQAAQHEEAYLNKLAQGYSDPALALDASRDVRETLGQYDRFSPAMRKAISTWAPFLPWYRNAVRFVYSTMPLKHPITQAVMLHAAQADKATFDTQTNQVPHDSFFGLPTGSLTSALRTGPTSYLDVGRYTPMGAFTDGPSGLLGAVGPQLQGPFLATQGLDPFGRAIKDPSGHAVTDEGQRALLALNQMLESVLGPVDVAHRAIQEHGSTPYQTDTLWHTEIKPNTHHGPPGIAGGLWRVWNPVYPTYLSANSGSGSGLPTGHMPTPKASKKATGIPEGHMPVPGGK